MQGAGSGAGVVAVQQMVAAFPSLPSFSYHVKSKRLVGKGSV